MTVPCLGSNEKPAIPRTALSVAVLAAADEAVSVLAKPPAEMERAKLAEYVGAIDRLVTVLMIDLLQLKDYAIRVDVLLTGCAKEQKND